jgi:hypothetical protein
MIVIVIIIIDHVVVMLVWSQRDGFRTGLGFKTLQQTVCVGYCWCKCWLGTRKELWQKHLMESFLIPTTTKEFRWEMDE